MIAAPFVFLLGTLAVLMGIPPLLTGRMDVGVDGRGPLSKLANLWTIGAFRSYTLRPLTARFVGLMLVSIGAFAVVRAVTTLLGL